ncbi:MULTISPECIES: hypothetical protein [unclassified Rhodococcus (in: high G+C Gram-positive bacteria)]|uniref:hypothetical protein n=1 Tax=unclassified Rhodococcus (in: high G+C Gram-positive bacteria) TaxID=192944 RepID=UPI00163A636E|nr:MULTISPECIES: hypothetical protein [unclassified Rhodococcus (in: high G+C Gram-positive bacteria)]MBC2641538.1 hypothetical protein [Rhodococcus sp. 3A]MBC2893717.1 hypothetical protein [Rhodococcus sp. 4CII]
MGRSATVVSPLVIALFVVLLVACSGTVEGSPGVVGVGEPIYGRPVSEHTRAELAVAAAARGIAPCGLLDEDLVGSFGQVTAFGLVGDLSTCHAELVPPRGTPANPVWVEVTVGEREPTERTGAGTATDGIEVRPAVGALPGTCTLYFSLPTVPGPQVGVAARWGHVSYLDGAGGTGDSAAGDDCAEARTVLGSVTDRLRSPARTGSDIPLAQQDPCRVVEKMSERGIETFAPGSRPYECLLTLRGGTDASVQLALSPEPPRIGGPEAVELDGKPFTFFRDALSCHYYFYPGAVFDTNLPSSPVGERDKRSNRLTASVAASAPSCGDAETLVLASAEMFDY